MHMAFQQLLENLLDIAFVNQFLITLGLIQSLFRTCCSEVVEGVVMLPRLFDCAASDDEGLFTDMEFGGNGDIAGFLAAEPVPIGPSVDVYDTGVEGETYEERRVCCQRAATITPEGPAASYDYVLCFHLQARILAHLDSVLDVPADMEGPVVSATPNLPSNSCLKGTERGKRFVMQLILLRLLCFSM